MGIWYQIYPDFFYLVRFANGKSSNSMGPSATIYTIAILTDRILYPTLW